jgi:2'-5' RNA ligase
MEYTTAIGILAPLAVQAVAMPLMKLCNFEGMLRVPAHITILFPFVPFADLDAACGKLRVLFADQPPFTVTLDGYGYFPTALYMKPVDPTPIQALYRAVHAQFPDCLPYGGAFGSETITPHLTVGEFKTEAERRAVSPPPYEPISFTVNRLHVIAGVEHEPLPWITHDVIPLGGAHDRQP